MKKVAIVFADGYEEIEALSVVDVMRRAGIECVMIGVDGNEVTSNHGITIKMNAVFNEEVSNMDMLVLPGGMPGAKNLKEDTRVLQLIQEFNSKNRLIGAICAAPIVLQAAGILKGRTVTCYPGFEKELVDATYIDAIVHVDGNIITSRGPATALEFAYTLLEQLGEDSSTLRDAMQYQYLLKNKL